MRYPKMKQAWPMLTVFVLFALTACGSGSGDSLTGVDTVVSGDVEFQSADLVNGERRSAAVDPQLGIRARIAEVARDHSRAMRDQGFFGHRGPDGKSLKDRLDEAGIQYSAAAENLARVNASSNPATVAHRELMASSSHRKNILAPSFDVLGVGVVQSGDTYWITQVFVQQ